MKISQVGIQLFTLREHAKTPKDLAKTLARVREIGYENVQVSGVCQMPESELLKILSDNDLRCVATHEPSKEILADPEKIVRRLKALGCDHTAYPFPDGIDFTSQAAIDELISKLNAAGKVFTDAGLTLSYHNHSIEFRRLGGKLILDMIYENTDKQHLQAEIDTYWVQHGGGDPVEWCNKLAGRLPLLHLKDYRINNANEPTFAEIGYGNLNWKPIIAAAEKAGCQWYLVEQDSCDGDPFEAITKSFEYIKENLCI